MPDDPGAIDPDADADAAHDDQGVRALLDALSERWAAGDGPGYGRLFTPDASYTTYVGTTYRGGLEIGTAHAALFGKFLAGTRLACEVLEIRYPSSDVAVVTTRGGVHKPSARPTLDKIQTYTLVRGDRGWLVAAFHNTRRRPWLEKISFRLAPGTRPGA